MSETRETRLARRVFAAFAEHVSVPAELEDKLLQRIREEVSPRSKPHYLPALSYLALNRAVEPIYRGLDPLGIFLVGSCLARPDFRDVDVRCMLSDEEYDRLFGSERDSDALWSLMCEAISAHLERATGLPIDFQIQRMSEANALHEGPRNALIGSAGKNYPGEVPSWTRTRLHGPGGHEDDQ